MGVWLKKGNQGGPLFLVCIGSGMTSCTEMGHGKLSMLRGWRGKGGDRIGRGRRGWGWRRSTVCDPSSFSSPAMCTWEALRQGWFVLKETISVPCYLPALPALSSLRDLKHEVHRAIFTREQGHLASNLPSSSSSSGHQPSVCLSPLVLFPWS